MEAEENFLLFLPQEQRASLRQAWYKGLITEAKMKYIFPLLIQDLPTQITYKNPANAPAEFIEHVYYETMPEKVRGPIDTINWKKIDIGNASLTPTEKALREIAAVSPKGRMRFPNFFPESSYLLVKSDKGTEVFSLIKNREHENISWIMGESLRLAPEEDTLTIMKGFHVFYPNLFFIVEENKLGDFIAKTKKLSNIYDYKIFEQTYGLSRLSKNFWEVYDELYQKFKEVDHIEAGQLDLSRYLMQ